MSDRKKGWYWVKDIDDPHPDYWETAYWRGDGWEFGDDFPVVGPRIPMPNEAPSIGTRYRDEAGEVVAVVAPATPGWEMLAADGCREHHEGQECLHHDNRRRIWQAMLDTIPEPSSK